MRKNPFVAFLLGFFPGGGLLYLRKLRGLFYLSVIIGLTSLIVIFAYDDEIIFFGLGISFMMYIVSIVDTIGTASKLTKSSETIDEEKVDSTERFYTIALSVVPGLGHFQLGLMNRGLTFLTAFFGLGAIILFAAILSGRGGFLTFLLLLPVIWIYSLFDAINQLSRKQQGEELVDESIIVELEKRHSDGQKSRTIATLLSIFPGAGHLYLGLQKRGIQLMAAFLFSIYILDVLRLGIFLFLVPIIWFYSFFDGLQKASTFEKNVLEDEPIISYLKNYQKWIGIGLIVLGIYYLTINIFIPIAVPFVEQYFDLQYVFHRYFQTGVVCLLLIGGGVKLLKGNKRKKGE